MHDRGSKHPVQKALIPILSACIALGIGGCGTINSERIVALRNKGYAIEQIDGHSFFVTEEGTEYYFRYGLSKPVFEKAVVTMPSKKKDAKAGQRVEITISKENWNRMSVVYCCPCNLKDAAGNETMQNEYMIFNFKDGFDKESLTNDRGFSDIESDYQFFTSEYMTSDDLSAVFDRGLQLAEAF